MAELHNTFIMAAYGFTGFVLCAMLVWVVFDYRAQQKALAVLEAQRTKNK